MKSLNCDKQVLVVIRPSTVTTEKMLMVEIGVIPEAYEQRKICEIGWIRSGDNLADAFTKIKKCPSLDQFISAGKTQADVIQWVNQTVEDSDGARHGRTVSKTEFPTNLKVASPVPNFPSRSPPAYEAMPTVDYHPPQEPVHAKSLFLYLNTPHS